jgi:uncharacterized protein YjdB
MVLWQLSNVPSGNYTFNGVAYGNSITVAVGTNKIMKSSDNGVTWESADSPANADWQCITFGDGLFVAIAQNNVIRSQDGTNWTLINNAPSQRWTSVTYGNGKFVAVCASNNTQRIMYSSNGQDWTLANQQNTNLNMWYGVTYGNGKFVAVGMNNTANTNIITSSDGISWNNSVTKTPSNDIALNTITFAAGKFVALGNKHSATSSNGTQWKVNTFARSEIKDWRSITHCNGVFLAVCRTNGTTDKCIVSSDGEKWKTITTPNYGWNSVTSGDNDFIAVSVNGKAMVANSQQTPSLGSFSIPQQSYNSVAITITPPQSNSTGTFSYTSNNPTVATISGNKIKVVGVGNATITATQAATTSFSSATATTTFSVQKATTNISPLSMPTQIFYGTKTVTIPKPSTDGDGLLTYSSSNTSVATIISPNNNIVSIVGIGQTTITCSHYETPNYSSAYAEIVLNVVPGVTKLGTFSISDKTYGQASFAIKNPTSNSNGSFSYTSSEPSVATITRNQILTIKKAGSTTITCTQAATDYFGPETTITTQLIVNKAEPVHGPFSMPSQYYGDDNFDVTKFTLTAPESNSNGVFSFTSSNESVATIVGNEVTIKGLGTTDITAIQAGTDNHLTKSTITSFVVSKRDHNLGTFLLPAKIYGDAPFTITPPTSTNDDTETSFEFTSSDSSVATINGNEVTIKGAGTATITAKQDESKNYKPSSTTAELIVSKASRTIYFQEISKSYTMPRGEVEIPAIISNGIIGSDIIGEFNYTSTDDSVASVVNGKLVLQKNGTITLSADQSESINYQSASTSIPISIQIQKVAQEVQFVLPEKTIGEEDFIIPAPTTGSTGSITYSSNNNAVAKIIEGDKIQIIGVGQATITASIAGDDYYQEKVVTSVINVIPKVNPTLENFNIASKKFGDEPFEIPPPETDSTGTFTYESLNPLVATINGSTITLLKAGTAIIRATQAATPQYNSYSIATQLTVNKGTPNLGTFIIYKQLLANVSFTVTPPQSNSTGTFTYTSPDDSVASVVNGSTITLHKAGTATITATQADDDNFNTANTTAELTVFEQLSLSRYSYNSIDNVTYPNDANKLNNWTSLAYGKGLFVAVGQNSGVSSYYKGQRVMTSEDGKKWRSRKTGDSNGTDSLWNAVAYGEPSGSGLFVALSNGSDSNTVYSMTSHDGITWSSNSDNGLEGLNWTSLTYGQGLFVAVSDSGSIATSGDGIWWNSTTPVAPSTGNYAWKKITYAVGKFVVVSNTNVSIYSTDGINWNTVAIQASPNTVWNDLTYGNGMFLAVGANSVMKSTDGENWTVTGGFDINWTTVAYGGDYFVALGNNTNNRARYSTDGVNWFKRINTNNAQLLLPWSCSAYGNGVVVALASGGSVSLVVSMPMP